MSARRFTEAEIGRRLADFFERCIDPNEEAILLARGRVHGRGASRPLNWRSLAAWPNCRGSSIAATYMSRLGRIDDAVADYDAITIDPRFSGLRSPAQHAAGETPPGTRRPGHGKRLGAAR